jgi:hypothetical protein
MLISNPSRWLIVPSGSFYSCIVAVALYFQFG